MPISVYDAVGGKAFFLALVDEFYDRVESDDVLRPMYPADLSESRRTTAGFLAQYWGGPPEYSRERGHPRLRMRHAHLAIGQRERDHWLGHMLAAVSATVTDRQAPEAVEQAMANYFDHASTAMINTPMINAAAPMSE
ncbi:MAG: globin [Acidimicrobiales bacterium]|nr:globin [Acidimicrobiales bacterium]